jgi:predicted metal-dependent enzyme (double-stranded beta helix superfamily)
MENFEEVAKKFLAKEMEFFQNIVDAQVIHGIKEKDYLRIPVYKGEYMVILMIWNTGAQTAIHDHAGTNGIVKVLAGRIVEEIYEFNPPKLNLLSTIEHLPGDVLDIPADSIHSIRNTDNRPSVTLNIYNTSSESMEGTMLFDPETEKLGILSDKAQKASWHEGPEAFESIVPFNKLVVA